MNAWLVGAAKLLVVMQGEAPSIAGVIRDGESGAPLPGAVVTLTDLGTAVVSDDSGRYVLRAVPPGPQHVSVRRLGYAPRTLHALVPRRGELAIDVALRAVPLRLRPVDVHPPIAVRGMDGEAGSSHVDRTLSLADVRNHPLLAEPDVFAALGGGEIAMRPESPSGVHIRGGAPDQTAYLLDGVPVFSPYHSAGTFSAWNPDAIERLEVRSSARPPGSVDVLAGTVSAVTRTPGSRLRTQGSVSTTQARATVDGPLGAFGAGFLVGIRSGFAGFIAPEREASYLAGEMGDVIAKIEAPALGGRARLLIHDSENELDASAIAEGPDVTAAAVPRNRFAWNGGSRGAEWSRRVGRTSVRVLGWSAFTSASVDWNPAEDSPLAMVAERRDHGVLVHFERSHGTTTTLGGVRVHRSRTTYRVTADSDVEPRLALDSRTPVTGLYVQQKQSLSRRVRANLELSATAGAGNLHIDPAVQLHWMPTLRLALSGSYGRSHQFSQSLRNPESVIGNVFPTDLFIGAGTAGIPVARSDQGVLAVELRPTDGLRLGAQVWMREFDGVLLVAPRTGEPFATSDIGSGSGAARGLSLEAAARGARYGLLASYGWQGVRLVSSGRAYSPDYAAGHLLDAGVIVFPTATSSIRIGGSSAFGRRTTALANALEWEACNLLDRGCELGGAPRHLTDSLGATPLPPYIRLDVGVRKHFHVSVAGRDALVAIFGTVTNVLGHRNALAVSTDPSTGERVAIGMRPFAPLVVGMDWRF